MKLIEIPEQTSPNEIDEEILEIFVEEVGEVLENIVTCFEAWRKNPNDHEALKDLRRNFHTLKGSGRLVGATAIGELGWRFEYMLNQLLEGKLQRNETLLQLIEQVEDVLPEMIEQFKGNLPTPYETVLLISQVDYFTQSKGQSLGEFESGRPQFTHPL
jgi:chemosensory pili system protein ChpA (sensor histidine kinase/response regulator)